MLFKLLHSYHLLVCTFFSKLEANLSFANSSNPKQYKGSSSELAGMPSSKVIMQSLQNLLTPHKVWTRGGHQLVNQFRSFILEFVCYRDYQL